MNRLRTQPDTLGEKGVKYRNICKGVLKENEFNFLDRAIKRWSFKPSRERFTQWWKEEFDKVGLDASSVVYTICQDLEKSLV